MNKPKLYIMCGLSGSGKSTIAEQIAEREDCIILSSDNIREELCGNCLDQSRNDEVFKMLYHYIRKYINQKSNIIVDATNLTIKSRRKILDNVPKNTYERICYIIPKDVLLCANDDMDKKNPVGRSVIFRQQCCFEIPFYSEGFDKIIIHDTPIEPRNNRCLLYTILSLMEGFNQDNPHHNMNLLDHSLNTFYKFVEYPYDANYCLAALFHDFGKYFVKSYDEDGVAHYMCHPNFVSYLFLTYKAHMMDEFSEFIKTEEEFLDFLFLINYHMIPFNLYGASEKTINKWKKRFGEEKFQMLLDFNKCDKDRNKK